MKISLKPYLSFILVALLTSFLTSCGSGGGGSSVSGAAFVDINAEPGTIDTGDRIGVEVKISEIHDGGIALKIKYPSELGFVADSAKIVINNEEFGIDPDVKSIADDFTYLVFYVSSDDFGDKGEGSIKFEVQGLNKIDDARIEVDPDVDDPDIDNSIEFNSADPQFDAEDGVDVSVKG